MEDYIVRATAADYTIRAFSAVTTGVVKEAKKLHNLSPVASAALGRTLTAAAMMSLQLKGENERLTIQIKGDGPLGGILVSADPKANLKGYVNNPDVHIPLNSSGKLDVAGATGKGYLNVIKDFGLKEPYVGYVELISGEIAEDIAYYFATSEQVPSVVALGVLVDTDGEIINSGGYIIQLMPGADEKTINYLENTVAAIPSVTQLLSNGETPESILDIILGGKNLIILDKVSCYFNCGCTRERMEANLISLGRKDLLKIADEQHTAEVQCHFCNKKYTFDEQELRGLIGG